MLSAAPRIGEVEYVGVYIGGRKFTGLVCRELKTTIVSSSLAHLVNIQPRRSITLPAVAIEGTAEISISGPATKTDLRPVDLAPLHTVDVLIGADLLPF